MLYYLLYALHTKVQAFNVFQYITFRAVAAGLTSLVLSLSLGRTFIKLLAGRQIGQQIRDDGPQSHLKKSGTPTMGGLLILFSVVLSTLLWSDLKNGYVWLTLGVLVAFGFIGWLDDYKKICEANSKGLSERMKLLLQTSFSAVAIGVLYWVLPLDTVLHVPFFRHFTLDLSWAYVFLAWAVIAGTSNSVNLTDGLDGLAIGPIISTAAAYAFLSYVAGHAVIAEYLYIPFVKGAGELTIFCMTVVCSGIGFLWFNTYPAQVFMGDVGALALGASLGTVALITKNELLLILIGGIFVVETISVIAQRVSFKTRKKRVFRMAPIHHHFELSGWAEPQITVRFWIISIILAMLGLATLKMR